MQRTLSSVMQQLAGIGTGAGGQEFTYLRTSERIATQTFEFNIEGSPAMRVNISGTNPFETPATPVRPFCHLRPSAADSGVSTNCSNGTRPGANGSKGEGGDRGRGGVRNHPSLDAPGKVVRHSGGHSPSLGMGVKSVVVLRKGGAGGMVTPLEGLDRDGDLGLWGGTPPGSPREAGEDDILAFTRGL